MHCLYEAAWETTRPRSPAKQRVAQGQGQGQTNEEKQKETTAISGVFTYLSPAPSQLMRQQALGEEVLSELRFAGQTSPTRAI